MAAKKAKKAKKKAKTGEVWPLTVFLLKADIKTFAEALHSKSKSLTIHAITGLGGLVLKDASAKTPRWATRLAASVSAASALVQQSPGALLFVKASGRTFAITFGYGRSLLAPEAIVHDFGIRAVLNSLDPTLIRSLDSRTLDASPQLSRKQFVEERPLAAFALDRMHEVVKGVTGRVKVAVTKFENDLITGTDSLHCRVRIGSLPELSVCCSDFFDLYEKKDYKANFDFIDHVRFVRDPVAVKQLDAGLLAKAKKKSGLSTFGFAPPRLLAGEELSRLRGSWQKTQGAGEITPDDIRKRLGELALKTSTAEDFVERVKRDRVELLDGSDSAVDGWSLYRCLLLEFVSTDAFILSSGDWYRVAKDFVEAIEKRFDSIVADSLASCPVSLPKQKKSQKTEGAYNIAAAKSMKIELFDKGNLTKGMGASQVEPCDLLDTKKGAFIHVKIGRSSAILSHLFNQGLVAALTFLDDVRARDNVRKNLVAKKAKVLAEPIQASNLSTIFAIIDEPPNAKKPWRLPFFSMLVASSVSDRVGQRGVHVYTVRVDAA